MWRNSEKLPIYKPGIGLLPGNPIIYDLDLELQPLVLWEIVAKSLLGVFHNVLRETLNRVFGQFNKFCYLKHPVCYGSLGWLWQYVLKYILYPLWKLVVVHSLSHSLSQSLWPHGLQHARLPCPSLSPGVCSSSYPLYQWCHPTISSSITSFSSCPQSFPV